jgi:dolichyl-diphosphooligosaccharide--protein glycosyltransferase
VFSGYLPVGGRILAALGVNKLSPLLTSVQENQGASLKYIVNQYGIALIIAIIGVFYELYMILTKRKESPVKAALYLAVILLLYGNMNLSYLTQMSATISSITAGIFIGDVVKYAFISEGGSLGKLSLKKSSKSLDPLPVIIAGTLVLIVVSGALLQFSGSLTMAKFHAPQIETAGLSPFRINNTIVVPLNDAWKEALEYINQSTPKDAVIIAWWDYGYWITVNTGRRTVADGATLNSTQIRLLARIMTGTDGEASALLKQLGAKPNETYILAYEIFYFFKNNDTLIVMPAYNMPSPEIEEAI